MLLKAELNNPAAMIFTKFTDWCKIIEKRPLSKVNFSKNAIWDLTPNNDDIKVKNIQNLRNRIKCRNLSSTIKYVKLAPYKMNNMQQYVILYNGSYVIKNLVK